LALCAKPRLRAKSFRDCLVIIISPSFLSREWPQRELDGLVTLEVQSGKTKILPIWREIDKNTLLQKSPVLAERVAGKSSEGIPALVQRSLLSSD
jgi:hypothetical protein